MEYERYYHQKHCRWCGEDYEASKPHNRDGFCSPKCKQAHHRAYKKYVTGIAAPAAIPGAKPGVKK